MFWFGRHTVAIQLISTDQLVFFQLSNSASTSLTSPQCGNMAREGLRTLVAGKRVLTEEQYASFEVRCHDNG